MSEKLGEMATGLIIRDKRAATSHAPDGATTVRVQHPPMGIRTPGEVQLWVKQAGIPEEEICPLHFLKRLDAARAKLILLDLQNTAQAYGQNHFAVLAAMVEDGDLDLTRGELAMVALMIGTEVGKEIALEMVRESMVEDMEGDIPPGTSSVAAEMSDPTLSGGGYDA